MKSWIIPSTCILLASCAPRPTAGVTVVDDKSLRRTFEQQMTTLTGEQQPTPAATLKQQLSRTSCRLELPAPGRRTLSPAQIYQQRIGSVVLFGRLHRCTATSCRKTHANIASGVVIHPDGIVLTNHHVVATDQERSVGMGVMTADGRAFLVDEVLAADEKADVAIVRLKDASGLTAAPLLADEPVGNPATIISHPAGRHFTLTHGRVSRYAKGPAGEHIMNVTADYARGSSGGPVFNDRGDVIGLVSTTYSVTYRSMPLATDGDNTLKQAERGKAGRFQGQPLKLGLNHQMTFKNATATSEILKLIER